jgi:hypothetical protein
MRLSFMKSPHLQLEDARAHEDAHAHALKLA